MIFEHLVTGSIGGIASLALATTALFLYVVYDLVVSDEMLLVEKAIWAILVLTTGLVGIALYLVLVKYQNEFIADHADLESLESRIMADEVGKLERLSGLKDEGNLTDEEFEQAKNKLLNKNSD